MRISAEHIDFTYRTGKGSHKVLEDVSLAIAPGETVGLLGPSGCGKSTLGKILCGLLKSDSGCVRYEGEALPYPFRGAARREIQILFQHPESSFNPRLTLLESLREIYRLYGLAWSEAAACEMLASFGIYAGHLHRFPSQLSGGELQRLALARVLLAEPKVIILDEPTSMLDSICQAQMVHLLMEKQAKSGLSYLFITHNEALCRTVSRRIFVMENRGLTEKKGD